MSFQVKFWGVRGSVACPSPSHIGFGGNTSCVEFQVGGETIICDAGTGIRVLGNEIMERGTKSAHILLSHTHWDHINGFPFFMPAFKPDHSYHIMAGHINPKEGGIRKAIAGQMAQPFFPVPIQAMQCDFTFTDFEVGQDFNIGPAVIRTIPLRHPNGATAYRFDYQGKSACYVTDTEHEPGTHNEDILRLIDGSDLVIYDSTYTEEEFPAKIGWGHSTWEEGVKLCQLAGARMLAAFHHDPGHDDMFMENLEIKLRDTWDGAIIARENMTLQLL